MPACVPLTPDNIYAAANQAAKLKYAYAKMIVHGHAVLIEARAHSAAGSAAQQFIEQIGLQLSPHMPPRAACSSALSTPPSHE